MSRTADPAIDQYLAAVNEVDGREADGFGIAPGWLVEDDRVGALIAAAMSTPAVNRPEQREVDTASYVRWVGEPETAWPLAHSDPFAHVDLIRAVLPRVRIEQCDRCGHRAEGYGLITVTTPPNFITLAACDGCLQELGLAESQYVRPSGPAAAG